MLRAGRQDNVTRGLFVDDASRLTEEVQRYGADESRQQASTIASLALPTSLDELAEIMSWHDERGHAVTVSGGRTGVVGGAVPLGGSHVIALDRFRGAESISATDDGKVIVRARAGSSLDELRQALADHAPQLALPMDPTETTASIGGMIATNASGPRSLRYGPTRRWVRAISVVLVDGSVLRITRGADAIRNHELSIDWNGQHRTLRATPIGKPSTKNSIGYTFAEGLDAIDVFIGSEGTLGIIAEAELETVTAPSMVLCHLQGFEDENSAIDFVGALRQRHRSAVLSIEYLDRRALALAMEATKAPQLERLAECAAGLVTSEIEITEAAEADLDSLLTSLDQLVVEHGGHSQLAVAGTDIATRRLAVRLRHGAPERINALIAERQREHPRLHKLATDLAVPDAALHTMQAQYRSRLGQAGLDYAIFGHVGDNHLHVNVLPRNTAELEQGRVICLELAKDAVRLGGAVSAEHGVGRLKKALLAVQYTPLELEAIHAIKRFFDPRYRLNPGVLVDQPFIP